MAKINREFTFYKQSTGNILSTSFCARLTLGQITHPLPLPKMYIFLPLSWIFLQHLPDVSLIVLFPRLHNNRWSGDLSFMFSMTLVLGILKITIIIILVLINMTILNMNYPQPGDGHLSETADLQAFCDGKPS